MTDTDQTTAPAALPPVMQAFMDDEHWPEMDHWLDMPEVYAVFRLEYLRTHPGLVTS
jgi:hypothetical protein